MQNLCHINWLIGWVLVGGMNFLSGLLSLV